MDTDVGIDEFYYKFRKLSPKIQKAVLEKCEHIHRMDDFLNQIKYEINDKFTDNFYNKSLVLVETKINFIYSNNENLCFAITSKL